MGNVWPVIITMLIALLAVAIAYRVNFLHKLVFGKGSAHVNASATAAINASPMVLV